MERPCSCSAVFIILFGCTLSLISAFVPFFNSGYLLMVSVLLAGITPYMVYAIAMPFLADRLLLISGLLLNAVHFWLVLSYRFTLSVDYSDNWIYYGPLLFAVAMLPLAIYALRVPYKGQIAAQKEEQPQTGQEKVADPGQ